MPGDDDAGFRQMLGGGSRSRDGAARTAGFITASRRPASIAGRAAPRGCRCARNTAFFATIAEAEAAGLRRVQALPPDRRFARLAPSRGDREGLRAAAQQRNDAEPRRARRRGGDQPVSFSPRVQADHRRDPARLCPHPPARPVGRNGSTPAKTSPQAIYAAGFGSSSRAYEAAPAALGMTPARGGTAATARRSAL